MDQKDEIEQVKKLMEGKLSLSGKLPDGVNMNALSVENQQQATLDGPKVEKKYKDAFQDAGGQEAVDAGLKNCKKELLSFERLLQTQEPKLPQTQIISWQGRSVQTFLTEHYDDDGRKMAVNLLKDMLSTINDNVDPSASIKIADSKGMIRTMMKCRMKYGNDVTKLTDAERCTITVSDVSKVYATLKLILQEYGLEESGPLQKAQPKKEHIVVVEVNDCFKKPMTSQYRHLQILLRIWDVVWEVQVNVPSILKVKNESGHDYYKTTRFVNEFLMMCAFRADKGMMDELLGFDNVRNVINPNAVKDRNGLTCLHHSAAAVSLPKMTETLIDLGANVWAVDKSAEWFPITFALARRHWKTAKILAQAMLKDKEDFLLRDLGSNEVAAARTCAGWLSSAIETVDGTKEEFKQLHKVMDAGLWKSAGTHDGLVKAYKLARKAGVDDNTCKKLKPPIIFCGGAERAGFSYGMWVITLFFLLTWGSMKAVLTQNNRDEWFKWMLCAIMASLVTVSKFTSSQKILRCIILFFLYASTATYASMVAYESYSFWAHSASSILAILTFLLQVFSAEFFYFSSSRRAQNCAVAIFCIATAVNIGLVLYVLVDSFRVASSLSLHCSFGTGSSLCEELPV